MIFSFFCFVLKVATAVSDVVRKELGTKGVLNIYYLSCQHELAIKGNQHDSTVSLQTTSTTTPATTLPLKNDIPSTQSASSQPCPLELIDYLGEYLDAGLWLYACKLPAPHKSNGWSSWYTMNLVKRQNWTLLACVGEATKLRDNKKCPAFAMFIRNRSKNDGGLKISTGDKVSEKEVILSIRGSRDPMDWSINLNEAPVPYEYLKGETGETSVQGYVHVGMYEGAIGLLDDYGIRERLLYLHRDKGYPIKVVGHSMGSSVACIVASELKKSLHKKYEFDYQTGISNGIKNVSKARVSLPNDISAIMYAPPPFVCEAVGQAMLEDKLCVGVVNGFDIIPRFSRSNVLSLIKEAKLNTPDADRWYQQDLTSLQSYVSTLGKANDMASGSRHLNTNSSIGTIDESASTEEIVDDGIFDIPEDVTPVSHPVTRTTTTTSTGAGAGTGTAAVLSQTQVETTNTAHASNPTMVSSALGSLGTLGSGAASTAANAFGSLSSSLFKARGSTGIEASAPPAHVSVSTHAHAASAPPLPEASAVNISSGKPMKPSRGVSPTAPVMAVSETDMNSKSNLGVNAAISDSSVKESAPPMPEIRMVVPGDIVYLNEEYGHVKATLIDYTAPTMNRILLISSRNVEDHKMFQYVIKMKELRRNHMYHQQRLLVGARDLPVWQDVLLFPSSDDSTSVSVVASVVNESSSATTTTATATAISTSSRATSVATAVTVSESLKDMKSKGIIEQVQNWTPCGVCALDTTWSNVLKSDASRARCTHHCRNCGTVVCTVCSPSGDRLMGEGIQLFFLFIFYFIILYL